MDNYFEKVLNDDLNNYIFNLLHKTQLNEVFTELFEKIKYFFENLFPTFCKAMSKASKTGVYSSIAHRKHTDLLWFWRSNFRKS